MPVVLGHFFDRPLPVVKHPEYRPLRHRNGPIGFAELACLPTGRLLEVDDNSPETYRDPLGMQEIENEIAVMLVNQAFQLLLHRVTLCNGRDVVMQRNDNDLANLFVLQRDRPCLDFRHADFREKVYYPTDNGQLPDVENDANHGDGDHRRTNEGFKWKASCNADQHRT